MDTEKARADYYENLCDLQKQAIERMHRYIHQTSGPCSLNEASPREWSLGSRCYYLQKDNDALRELCEEYRKALEETRLKIN